MCIVNEKHAKYRVQPYSQRLSSVDVWRIRQIFNRAVLCTTAPSFLAFLGGSSFIVSGLLCTSLYILYLIRMLFTSMYRPTYTVQQQQQRPFNGL